MVLSQGELNRLTAENMSIASKYGYIEVYGINQITDMPTVYDSVSFYTNETIAFINNTCLFYNLYVYSYLNVHISQDIEIVRGMFYPECLNFH